MKNLLYTLCIVLLFAACKNNRTANKTTTTVKVSFPLIGSELFADMERAEQLIIQAKDVDSIIMRAAVLNNKPARGYIVRNSAESVGKMFISREDIASFMLDAVTDTSFDGKAISLFTP